MGSRLFQYSMPNISFDKSIIAFDNAFDIHSIGNEDHSMGTRVIRWERGGTRVRRFQNRCTESVLYSGMGIA